MLPKMCNIVKLIRNNGQKINFTTVANLPPKICNVVKRVLILRNNDQKVNFTTAANGLSTYKRDILLRNNGQKVNFTTNNVDMVNSTTDEDEDDYYGRFPPCDIVKLLSTYRRDFLIRNDGQEVKIDTLKGKFVGLLHVCYPSHHNKPVPLGLLEAYKTLYSKGDFEVVFVALTEKDDGDWDSYQWFNQYFQNMPWLAVPFSDFETRKRVLDVLSADRYERHYGSDCRIFAKSGNVVCPNSLHWFEVHGANWYPLTMRRIEALDHGMKKTPIKDLSFKELLSSPSRDYVLNKNRDKVLIDDLESKVVGLYFFCSSLNHRDSAALLSVYDELKAKGMDFEIVFINQYTEYGYLDEESFNKYFENMPWLAIPFGDATCEKLVDTLSIGNYTYNNDGTALVIIKPGVFCQFYGFTIMETYGIKAYPFTKEKAAEAEIEKLSLFPLLDAEGQEFVIRNDIDKTKIEVLKLKEKRICMLFLSNHVSFKLLSHLIKWYNKVRMMDCDFEVIYMYEWESVTQFDDISKQMPSTWLTLPFGVGSKIRSTLGGSSSSSYEAMVAAFKPDGKYLTRLYIDLEEDWELLTNSNYPYNVNIDDTVQEMWCEIAEDYDWEK